MKQVFGRIYVLYIHDQDGGFIGYWYHPNIDALIPKFKDIQKINKTWDCQIVSYKWEPVAPV